MFKVICIDDSIKTRPEAPFIIKFGEVYEVVNTHQFINYDYIWYELSVQKDVAYIAQRFIPLSNIDEKELLEERELQLQNA